MESEEKREEKKTNDTTNDPLCVENSLLYKT